MDIPLLSTYGYVIRTILRSQEHPCQRPFDGMYWQHQVDSETVITLPRSCSRGFAVGSEALVLQQKRRGGVGVRVDRRRRDAVAATVTADGRCGWVRALQRLQHISIVENRLLSCSDCGEL